MRQKISKILLTLLFGLVQILGVILLIIGMYYVGHLPTALDIIEVTGAENANTAQFVVAGSLLSFCVVFVLAIIGTIGYLIYLWGKFTRKRAAVWNTKINVKLSGWRQERKIRANQNPDWEV